MSRFLIFSPLSFSQDLFDIAHADAQNLIKNREDWDFLEKQRQKGRPGSMAGLDVVHKKKLEAKEERLQHQKERRKRSQAGLEEASRTATLASSSSSSSQDEDTDEDMGACGAASPPKRRATRNVMSPNLAAALDRTQVSSRNATYVLSEAASSMGLDAAEFNINPSSIQRQREKFRAERAGKVKEGLKGNSALVVHWDGKMMEDLTSREHVDRLPVLVSGFGEEQLLGVPKLPSGTGQAQASAVLNSLDEWGLSARVAALCFDTTASNTGLHSGACTLIEQGLQKDLLYFACRHHVMELICGAAFEAALGSASTGPDILLFKRFRDHWPFIDQTTYQPFDADAVPEEKKNALVEFASSRAKQVRDDYQEFLNLVLVILGAKQPTGFRQPGAMHRARWMAKVIYSLKIFLFRGQFRLSKSEESGIKELALFSVTVYMESWFSAPSAVDAPLNDWRLMRTLIQYSNSNRKIAEATKKKFAGHQWYLSEESISLALFDSRLSAEKKREMVKALDNEAPPHPPKRPRIPDILYEEEDGLATLTTKNSLHLFHLLDLPRGFLKEDPTTWEKNAEFLAALERVRQLPVINDRAERAVALAQDLNRKLTVREEQYQFLLQVIHDHRRQFPVPKKQSLLK